MRKNSIWLIYAILIVHILTPQTGVFAEPSDVSAKNDPIITGHESTGMMVVAKVNGAEITMSALMNKIQKLTRGKQQNQELTPVLAEQIKQRALNMLITEELAYQHAKALNIAVAPEDISRKIIQLKKNLKSESHFEDYMKLKNIKNESELRTQIEKFLMVKEAIRQEVDQKIQVSEDDVKQVYENNIDKFTEHERIDITDVIFFLDPEVEESVERARQIRMQIIKEYDNNPSLLASDGSFTIRENITLNKTTERELYEAAKTIQENELSDVMNIEGTLHIVKLTGYKPEKVKTLPEARPQIMGQIRSNLRKMKLEEWKANLKTDAEIEIIDFEVN